jgi:hypothetical protein
MTNEEIKNGNVEIDEANEVPEIEETFDGDNNNITDWEKIAKRNTGIGKRFETKFNKLNAEFDQYKKDHPDIKPKEEAKPQDKKEFDLAEKAFLTANGIKREEFGLVIDEMKSSGKSIEEILDSKYFQEKRSELASKEALPRSDKRTSPGSVKDQVDYWIQKGEFPPNTQENKELRRKIVHALAERDKDHGSKFTNNPIVM